MTVLTAELETPCCATGATAIDTPDPSERRASALLECTGCGRVYEAVLTLRNARHREKRYPLSDLERLLDEPSAASIADRMDVDKREITRWRSEGLTHQAADRAATAFGFHPLNVWPNYALERTADDRPARSPETDRDVPLTPHRASVVG